MTDRQAGRRHEMFIDHYVSNSTFEDGEVLAKKYQKPIPDNTVTWLDAKTGAVKKQWGKQL